MQLNHNPQSHSHAFSTHVNSQGCSSSHSQMESQLTDSQDPDEHLHSEDSTLMHGDMMHGDSDDLEGYLEEDRDELAQSEVQPPRKLLRLHTSGDTSLSRQS